MNVALEKAESALKLLPGFQYLYCGNTGDSVLEYLVKRGWAIEARDEETVLQAERAGMDRYDIYYTGPCEDPAVMETIIGKCRLVASDFKEIEQINEAAAKVLAPGYLEVIGIAVIPENYGNGEQSGFSMKELPGLSVSARKLRSISIRGCFVRGSTDGLYGESLGRYLRDCYETAKQVTAIIPCGMSYVNAGSCMEPLFQTLQSSGEIQEEFRTAADILVNQNQTAFYAKLLIQ
ncbi:hypothetical protein [Lacrimispora sp.]|uniref:hypothetical protein n=1 Tax=Lacrimispora sp. TaxID=2719234 RepID=UPI00345F7983